MKPTSIDSLSTFSRSCGAGSLHLTLLEGDGRLGMQRPFDLPFLVVGRSPDADLRLDHEQVSWRHCYLQVVGGRLVTIDLDSQGGVVIDGVAQRIGWVAPGKVFQIGPVTLRFEGASGMDLEREGGLGGETLAHPLSAQFARDLPSAALEIEGAGGPTYGWRMSRALALIGRSTACQVRLMNPSVSKFHAALVRTPEGLWIVDLLSREGITVDGVNVRAARLEEGVVCQVGTFTLRLRCGTLAPAPPRSAPRERSLSVASLPLATNRSLKAHAPAPSGPAPLANGRSVLLATPAGGAASGSLAPGWSPTGYGQGDESAYQPAWNPADSGHGTLPPSSAGADPTQQAMMMLAQMLGTMHRDHMTLVKDELAEIRKLAEEMHALRVEIGQKRLGDDAAPASTSTPAAAAPAAPRSPAAAQAERPVAANAPQTTSSIPVAEPAPLPTNSDAAQGEPPLVRDPKDCLAIASQFLADYERKQEGHWTRLLRIVSGVAGG